MDARGGGGAQVGVCGCWVGSGGDDAQRLWVGVSFECMVIGVGWMYHGCGCLAGVQPAVWCGVFSVGWCGV